MQVEMRAHTQTFLSPQTLSLLLSDGGTFLTPPHYTPPQLLGDCCQNTAGDKAPLMQSFIFVLQFLSTLFAPLNFIMEKVESILPSSLWHQLTRI